MIKITKKASKSIKKDEYPCIVEAKDSSGTIILMTERGKGVILEGKGTTFYNTAGNYTGGWVMNYFKPYEGKITIENA